MADNFRIGPLMMAGILALGMTASAYADSTVIDGPGFKVEQKDGLFGTSKKTYTDALGNTYEEKTGLFGRKTTKSSFFGSKAEHQGDNVEVTGPNGETIVSQKKTLFGGKKTHVNGNSLWENLKDLLGP